MWVNNFFYFTFAGLVNEFLVEGKTGKETQKCVPENIEVYSVVGFKFGNPKDVWQFVVSIYVNFIFLLSVDVDDLFTLDKFLVQKFKEIDIIEVLQDGFWVIMHIIIFS